MGYVLAWMAVLEGVLTALVLGAAGALALLGLPRGRGLALGTAVVTAGATALAVGLAGGPLPPSQAGRPIEVHASGYVSSDTCRACHPQNYATWHASYHRSMTQVATPETVLGDFDGVELSAAGRRYRLVRRGDEFFAELDDPEWRLDGAPPRVTRQIVMTTGSHHLQLYWYASGHTRVVGLFPFGHFVDDDGWFPVRGNFITPPLPPGVKEPLPLGQWNRACITCHAVRGQPHASGPLDMQTTTAELGVACEACHGPAAEHVRANRDPLRRYLGYLDGEPDATIVDPSDLPHALGSQVCGRCHAVWGYAEGEEPSVQRVGIRYQPGDDLEESGLVLFQGPGHDPGMFWPDGMVRIGGREYTGQLDSPCYQAGELSCFSCHRMHQAADDPRPTREWADDQLARGMRSNEACTRCHAGFREDLEQHTRHPPDSSGSSCYNCHMPYTSLALRKAIRSHQIDVPSAAADLASGRPNACNGCHLDKTLAWTARHLAEGYGQPVPEIPQLWRSVPGSAIDILAGDAADRALAAWSMGWAPAREASRGDDWMAVFLAVLLDDPYDAVRYHARRSLRRQPGFADFAYEFMGPPDERAAAPRRATDHWVDRRTAAGQSTDLGFLLEDPDAALGSGIFAQLRLQRDDRPVAIKE